MLVYIGTYTRGESEGIYVYRLDAATGALQPTGQTAKAESPSYLAIRPGGRHLYAVNEAGQFAGQPGGGVSAFAIDPGTGGLSFINHQPSGGGAPCYVSVDQTGRYVLAANYGSGSVVMFPVRADGGLGETSDFVQHQGASIDPGRQKGPHAHFIEPDPGNRFALSCDLGLDKVLIYRLDLERGKLIPNTPPWGVTNPGSGPRHLAFHPNGTRAYVIHELDSTMAVFAYDGAAGTLTALQTVTTIPEGFTGTNYCADVHVAPSGRFLYGSNRGHDSIAIFAIHPDSGLLTPIGHEPTQGKNPRNFVIDPSGTFLLAANQDSDNIVSYRIDPDTGKLAPTGHVARVPKPVCLKLLP